MTPASGAAPLAHDPLRRTRTAVSDGRFRDAWREFETLPPDVRRSAEGQLLGAMASWRLGEFARSRVAALQARDQFRAMGDADGEMRSENVAAAGAFALGDLAEAERGFQRALVLADALADDLMTARCANNIGNVAYYLARHPTALSFYRLATATFEKLAFCKGLAESWLNSAVLLHDIGQHTASREAADRAIEAAERSADARVLGQALAARSETDVALGDIALAQAEALRARALATAHDHAVGEADALRILAIAARRGGDPQAAAGYASDALAIATRVNDPWRVAEIHREMGEQHAVLGRPDDAARAFEDAALAFERLGAARRAEDARGRAAQFR